MAIKYRFSFSNPALKYIDIEFSIDVANRNTMTLHLASWRPGRYELGNFAKNIQQWKPYDENGNELPYRKITKDCWEVDTKGISRLLVKYNYYAAQMDAGACWLDTEQLYVNPIHCCLFEKDSINDPCELSIDVPDKWGIATSLKQESESMFYAEDFHELVDSPFIASPTLKHLSYIVNGINFHIHIQGDYSPDSNQLLSDFRKFTEVQLNMMKELPHTMKGTSFSNYHFLLQVLPYNFYHGVEHLKSTMLAIGSSEMLKKKPLYNELMGVASHELFHVWNIKSIRPKEMLPYDYTKENYARTGYIYEGITTYYGDLFLARSGFFTLDEYLNEIAIRLQKHLRNKGRFNYSVAQSSFDTWLDGYNPGVPGRKTSIYDEGSLIALMIDFIIRKSTVNKKSLDNVMQRMFNEFAKKGKGYTEMDFKQLCNEEAGRSFEEFFKTYINGASSYQNMVEELLAFAGLHVVDETDYSCNESYFGFLKEAQEEHLVVSNVAHDSPAYHSGLKTGDQIISIREHNDYKTLQPFLLANDSIVVNVKSNGDEKSITINKSKISYFPVIKIKVNNNQGQAEKEFLENWCGVTLVPVVTSN